MLVYFVGGPLDGLERNVEKEAPEIRVPVYADARWFPPGPPPPEATPSHVVCYRDTGRRRIRGTVPHLFYFHVFEHDV
jgi:hypothetical protein